MKLWELNNFMWHNVFFFFKNTKNFNTHKGRGEKIFKETNSGVYLKGYNSWIHNTDFMWHNVRN